MEEITEWLQREEVNGLLAPRNNPLFCVDSLDSSYMKKQGKPILNLEELQLEFECRINLINPRKIMGGTSARVNH